MDETSLNDELQGRLAMLEVLGLMGLTVGLHALNLDGSDPDQSKARATLETVRRAIEQRCEQIGLSKEAASNAKVRGDELLSHALGTLDLWRPRGGTIYPPQNIGET